MMNRIIRSSGTKIVVPLESYWMIRDIIDDLTVLETEFRTGMEVCRRFYYLSEAVNSYSLYVPRNYPIPDCIMKDSEVFDEFVCGEMIDVEDKIVLREKQVPVYNYVMENECCVVKAPPGFGKTILGIKVISGVKTKTLVLVDQRDLVKQWRERFYETTNLKRKQIAWGVEMMDRKDFSVAIITIQSLIRMSKKEIFSLVRKHNFGMMILDEVHALVGPDAFTEVMMGLPIKKIVALSATPYRNDGTQRIFRYWLSNNYVEAQYSKKPKIEVVRFDSFADRKFSYIYQDGVNFNKIRYMKCQKSNNFRNTVLGLFEKHNNDKDVVLIISSLRTTSEAIFKDIKKTFGVEAYRYYDKFGKIKELPEQKVVLSSDKKCGKGIDLPHTNVVIITSPFSTKTSVEQIIGRSLRTEKDTIVYDLYDTCYTRDEEELDLEPGDEENYHKHPIRRSLDARIGIYKELEFEYKVSDFIPNDFVEQHNKTKRKRK